MIVPAAGPSIGPSPTAVLDQRDDRALLAGSDLAALGWRRQVLVAGPAGAHWYRDTGSHSGGRVFWRGGGRRGMRQSVSRDSTQRCMYSIAARSPSRMKPRRLPL